MTTGRLLKIDMAVGAVLVLVFIFLSFSRPLFFEKIEKRLYDLGVDFSLLDGPSKDHGIVLIDIDDNSLAKLGAWPWPRSLIADMIEILNSNGAKLIGLNIPFRDKEIDIGLQEVKAFREKYETYSQARQETDLKEWILENLDQIVKRLDNDTQLTESVKKGKNVILPVLIGPDHDQWSDRPRDDSLLYGNFLDSSLVSPSLMERISKDLIYPPFNELAQNAAGLGHGDLTSGDPMAGRSHPAYISYKGSLLPSFPLRLAIAALDQQPESVLAGDDQILINSDSVPLSNGKILIRFGDDVNGFRRFSFSEILAGSRTVSLFRDKIVLIGFNHAESRRFDTPYSVNMPESILIANILTNILNFNSLSRPGRMLYIEFSVLFLLGIFMTFYLPPKGSLSLITGTAGIILLNLATGVMLLAQFGLWYKPVYISGYLAALCIYLLLRELFASGRSKVESMGDSRSLGLELQGRGQLDKAFKKFRKLPLDDDTKDLMYRLGLEYENKQMKKKALAVYKHINKHGGFRDLKERVPLLRESLRPSTPDADLGADNRLGESITISESQKAPGSKVGRYQIINELGKGSIGFVYKARDPKLNRVVAIKTIRFSEEFDEDLSEEIKENFLKDVEKAARLRHPSIVTIHEVGEDQGLVFITMEFLEGEGLNRFIERGKLFHFRRALTVTAKIANAIDFAHREGVIHRGIKPGNIILLKDGQIKITDFAIARALSSFRTRTGVLLGTPDYMSPEQVMGQKIDSRSDIFSLGVLFYQMITGELPFRGKNLKSLLYQITQVKHPPLRRYNNKIPKVCEQIIDRALAKDQVNRFKSAGDMGKVIALLGKKMDQLRRPKPVN